MRVIDDLTIQLYASEAEALAPGETFTPGDVNATDDRITIAGHTFSNGDRVTYATPAPYLFRSSGVDVLADGSDSNNDQIYIENHGYSVGDRVRYRTDGAPIGGLGNFGVYFDEKGTAWERRGAP